MSDKKRKLNNTTLTMFFKKKKETSEDEDESNTSNSVTLVENNKEKSPVSKLSMNNNDIANYFKQTHTSDESKLSIFKALWYPDISYEFPTSGKRNLKFQFNWFSRWEWLAYSKTTDGAYCKYCVFFSLHHGGVGSVSLKSLVKIPFSKWKDAVEIFRNHEITEYHKMAVLRAQSRLAITEKKQISIDLQLDSALRLQVQDNRSKLSPIIETIIFCGRQKYTFFKNFIVHVFKYKNNTII